MSINPKLSSAIADGVIDAQQAEKLSAYFDVKQLTTTEAINPDDERFRLIGGFNDIFVAIGVGLVIGALIGLMQGVWRPLAIFTISWGLAEVFTRRYRMALPSIMLSLIFVLAAGGVAWYSQNHFQPFPATSASALKTQSNLMMYRYSDLTKAGPAIVITMAVAAALHYWRFRVSIDIAICAYQLLAAMTTAIQGAILFAYPNGTIEASGYMTLISGLILFGLGMKFDQSDPLRVTRRSDIGFWLHLAAAPQIVNGALFVTGADMSAALFKSAGLMSAISILALSVIFTLIAILIDRRALIVSALAYTGGAIAVVILRIGGLAQTLALTLLFVGVMVLLLSIGWRPLRACITSLIPAKGLVARLPPVQTR